MYDIDAYRIYKLKEREWLKEASRDRSPVKKRKKTTAKRNHWFHVIKHLRFGSLEVMYK